jgi:hypothetical protein
MSWPWSTYVWQSIGIYVGLVAGAMVAVEIFYRTQLMVMRRITTVAARPAVSNMLAGLQIAFSGSIMGFVSIHVDYSVPVEKVRAEVGRILMGSSLWDGRFWNLQVTDLATSYVQLRALMTSKDAPTSWDLRCEVREKLLEYVRREHPDSLPRFRASLTEDGVGRAGSPAEIVRVRDGDR